MPELTTHTDRHRHPVKIAYLAFTGAAAAAWRAAKTSYATTWRTHTAPSRALLIDLDCMGIRNVEFEPTLRLVVERAGPCRVIAAAGHRQASLLAQHICRDLGIPLLKTTRGNNAADKALLDYSRILKAEGITHVVLCTHDSDMARIPIPYSLILTGAIPPGRKLISGATSVHYIPPTRRTQT